MKTLILIAVLFLAGCKDFNCYPETKLYWEKSCYGFECQSREVEIEETFCKEEIGI